MSGVRGKRGTPARLTSAIPVKTWLDGPRSSPHEQLPDALRFGEPLGEGAIRYLRPRTCSGFMSV
jgi:hypothetical protein